MASSNVVSMKVELAQGQLTTGGGLGGLGGGGKLAASRGLTSNGGGGGKAGHVCWTSHVQVLKPPLSSSTFWNVWLLDGNSQQCQYFGSGLVDTVSLAQGMSPVLHSSNMGIGMTDLPDT